MKYLSHLFFMAVFAILFSVAASCSDSGSSSNNTTDPTEDEDCRSYQHGIDLVKKTDGNYWLIWASSGNPPTGPDADWCWTHDIYYSAIDRENPLISPFIIIEEDEAQEPASSAIARDGSNNIMITNEDGYNVDDYDVGQRYGVYTEELDDVKPYTADSATNTVALGGHSGHVAACGNYFVVHWSDGWDDSIEGADGIGTGEDVLLDVYDTSGNHVRRVELATDTDERDWWPLIAGSNSVVCMAWQRYNDDDATSSLMYAVYNPDPDTNPSTNVGTFVIPKTNLDSLDNMKYYTYDVQYYESIDRFMIRGTYAGNESGFAYLINPSTGAIVDSKTDLAPIQRECQSAASLSGASVTVVYPTYPNGVEILSVTASTITLTKKVSGTTNWSYIGTDGYLKDANTAVFFTLSTIGVKTVTVSID